MRSSSRVTAPPAAHRPPANAPAGPAATPLTARAAAVQRAAGNRAAAAVLARWVKHPDPEQKGVMVPDSVAEELTHSNPPHNA